MSTFKPVVFFNTVEPVTALLKIHFKGGRPWTFFPDPTNYTQVISHPVVVGVPLPAKAAPKSVSIPSLAALPCVQKDAPKEGTTSAVNPFLSPWFTRKIAANKSGGSFYIHDIFQ